MFTFVVYNTSYVKAHTYWPKLLFLGYKSNKNATSYHNDTELPMLQLPSQQMTHRRALYVVTSSSCLQIDYMESIGIMRSYTAWVMTAYGIAEFSGRLLCATVAGKIRFSLAYIYAGSAAFVGVATFLAPQGQSLGVMYVYAIGGLILFSYIIPVVLVQLAE